MGKKWRKVDPAEIKVGDRVRMVDEYTDCGVKHRDTCDFEVTDVVVGGVNDYAALSECRTWYIRTPKKLKPPTRPDEPPVGTFFRVDRTAHEYVRIESCAPRQYFLARGEGRWDWEGITEPGDTITLLDLVERES